MKKLVFLILLLLFKAFEGSAQVSDVNISNYAFWDTEPYIAVNPVNPGNIITGWMKITGMNQISIHTKASFDGGQTWSSGTSLPHLYPSFTSADVSIDFDNAGNAYVCYIDFDNTADSGYVMVAKSVNGGASWNAPVKVTSALESPDLPIDRPWIAVDRSPGPYSGRLYVTSKSVDIGAIPHHVWLRSSSDGGATWGALQMVDDSIPIGPTSNAMAVPAVGADGNLYIGYLSYMPSLSPFIRMISVKSADGGSTFAPYVVANLTGASASNDTLYQFSYTLNANPANPGNLIFTWTDAQFGDMDIVASVSNNSGVSWSSPVRLNDDAQNNGIGQDMSWASFSSSGKYAVAWRDRRNGGVGSTAPFEIYTTVSLNGGNTFAPNYNLSSTPSPFINIQKGNDFLGIALTDTMLIADWCDQRTGNTEIFSKRSSISNITGIKEATGAIPFYCFPNPVLNELNLRFTLESSKQVRITLCDLQGRELTQIASDRYSQGDHEINISTALLTAGTYLLKLESENITSKARFSKLR